MKKIVLAVLGATLMAGVAMDGASAAQRYQTRGTVVQSADRANDGFRESYNAYGRGFDRSSYDTRGYGGAISAPAGR